MRSVPAAAERPDGIGTLVNGDSPAPVRAIHPYALDRARVAVVHDWLVTYAGAERVLEQILTLFPRADLFTLLDFMPAEHRGFLAGHRVRTSFLQKLPGASRRYRSFLPLMPLAVEQFDVSGYDVVISSSHAVAKGVITGPDQLHICYCHSPIRYAWDLQHSYLREAGLLGGPKAWLARWMLHRIRIWDARTANGVDAFVANSAFIARRLEKVYRRESVVVHPPVDVESFTPRTEKEDFYLAASRMVPYKRMPLIVDAFAAMPDRSLVVIGDGPELAKVRARATPNVRVMGYQPASVLRDAMQRARALVFAAEEDFGIMPVEAQACGTPVIAFGRGGALETVIDGETGLLFHEQSVPAIIDAVERFERHRFCPRRIRVEAERFSADRFRNEFGGLVERLVVARHGAPSARLAAAGSEPEPHAQPRRFAVVDHDRREPRLALAE